MAESIRFAEEEAEKLEYFLNEMFPSLLKSPEIMATIEKMLAVEDELDDFLESWK